MAAGVVILVLSACGQTESASDAGNPLYEAFLKNEIGVANPYVEGMELTVMDDEGYESEFENAWKEYAYVDVNNDEKPELIFKISSNLSELMYIVGICDNELVCFDVFETHTKNIAFGEYPLAGLLSSPLWGKYIWKKVLCKKSEDITSLKLARNFQNVNLFRTYIAKTKWADKRYS